MFQLAGCGASLYTLASLQGGWRRKRTLKWRWHLEEPCCRDKQHSVFPSSGEQISGGLSQSPHLGREFFEFVLIYRIFYLSAPWIRYLLKKLIIAKHSQIFCLLLLLKLYIYIYIYIYNVSFVLYLLPILSRFCHLGYIEWKVMPRFTVSSFPSPCSKTSPIFPQYGRQFSHPYERPDKFIA